MFNETGIGTYNCDLIKEVAYISFLRTHGENRFDLKVVLGELGLKKAGKFTILAQHYYFEKDETQIMPLYSNFWQKCWLALLDRPMSQVITRKAKVRVEGPQGDLPPGATFDYAYTKISVPIK